MRRGGCKKKVEKGTQKRDVGGFHAVFLMGIFLNSLREGIGAVRGGI